MILETLPWMRNNAVLLGLSLHWLYRALEHLPRGTYVGRCSYFDSIQYIVHQARCMFREVEWIAIHMEGEGGH